MSKTRATQVLAKAGVSFTVHRYDYDPNAERVGLQAAEAIGEKPHRVLKTLMAEVDGKPVCVVVPCDRDVSMKKLASAFGGKTANMMKPADAERLTGYMSAASARSDRKSWFRRLWRRPRSLSPWST